MLLLKRKQTGVNDESLNLLKKIKREQESNHIFLIIIILRY